MLWKNVLCGRSFESSWAHPFYISTLREFRSPEIKLNSFHVHALQTSQQGLNSPPFSAIADLIVQLSVARSLLPLCIIV